MTGHVSFHQEATWQMKARLLRARESRHLWPCTLTLRQLIHKGPVERGSTYKYEQHYSHQSQKRCKSTGIWVEVQYFEDLLDCPSYKDNTKPP